MNNHTLLALLNVAMLNARKTGSTSTSNSRALALKKPTSVTWASLVDLLKNHKHSSMILFVGSRISGQVPKAFPYASNLRSILASKGPKPTMFLLKSAMLRSVTGSVWGTSSPFVQNAKRFSGRTTRVVSRGSHASFDSLTWAKLIASLPLDSKDHRIMGRVVEGVWLDGSLLTPERLAQRSPSPLIPSSSSVTMVMTQQSSRVTVLENPLIDLVSIRETLHSKKPAA